MVYPEVAVVHEQPREPWPPHVQRAEWHRGMAVHLDFRDHIYDIDLLGDKKIVNNLEAHLGLSIFF